TPPPPACTTTTPPTRTPTSVPRPAAPSSSASPTSASSPTHVWTPSPGPENRLMMHSAGGSRCAASASAEPPRSRPRRHCRQSPSRSES
ncbi:hypothetical protein HK405_010852, partial [Cladochytrium tenue]